MAVEVNETYRDAAIPGTGFTKAHQLFRETVRRFIDQEINPYMDEWEEAENFPAHESVQEGRRPGAVGAFVPRRVRRDGGRLLVQHGAGRRAGPRQRRRDSDGHGRADRTWPRRRWPVTVRMN